LRQELAPAEKARLTAELRATPNESLEDDLCLNALLRRLPDQPVPTNFTQLVLEAVSRDTQPPVVARLGWRRWALGRWLPKPALASALLGAGLLGYFQYQSHARMELAQSVAQISQATEWVGLSALMDFEAIRRLGQEEITVDEQLLTALQ